MPAVEELQRKFNPNQLRDHDGKWTDSPVGFAIEQFEDLYSAILDEAAAGDVVVSVHKNGDMVLSTLDDGRRVVLSDGLDPDKARSIADALEWATSEDIGDGVDNDPKTHLVDWQYAEDDIVVGYDMSGDVSLRFPRKERADPNNLGDFKVHDLGIGDAADLAEALQDMADRSEELGGASRSHAAPTSGQRPSIAELRERLAELQRRFDPGQPRDFKGRWTDTGALDATPAKLVRAPGGHTGDYAGEALTAPAGHGSVRALSEYEGYHYSNTNSYLRKIRDTSPDDPLYADDARRVAEIDKTMAVSPLQEDVRVDRIIQHGAQVFGKQAWYGDVVDLDEPDFDVQDEQWERWEAGARPDLTGLRWREKGYSSTTADPKVAEEFGGRWRETNEPSEGEPVIMRILAPKGTGAVQLAEMGHAAEILLQRDLTFEVAADHGVDADGYRRLDVRVVPDVE